MIPEGPSPFSARYSLSFANSISLVDQWNLSADSTTGHNCLVPPQMDDPPNCEELVH